jgi:hypothetical protein
LRIQLAPLRRARVRTRSTGSPCPCSSSATVPRNVPAASGANSSCSSSRSAASVASTADEKNGPGNGSRPISSITTTMSTSPRPSPPWSSGTSMPVQPISAMRCQSSSVKPRSSSAIARMYAPDASLVRKARTASRNASWSAENVKSIECSGQPAKTDTDVSLRALGAGNVCDSWSPLRPRSRRVARPPHPRGAARRLLARLHLAHGRR